MGSSVSVAAGVATIATGATVAAVTTVATIAAGVATIATIGATIAATVATGATVATIAAGATIASVEGATVATVAAVATVGSATIAGAAIATIATTDSALLISKRLAISWRLVVAVVGAEAADTTVATVELTIAREVTIAREATAKAVDFTKGKRVTTAECISEFDSLAESLLGSGGSLSLDRSSVEFVADVNKATLAARATVVSSSLSVAGTTEVSVDTNTGSNDALADDGAGGLTVDTVGVEATSTSGSLSLEITSSLEVKVEVNITILLDLAKSEVKLLLVVDIKVLLEVATAFNFSKAEVEILLVSDIELLFEVLKASEVLASLEVSRATSIDGLGVAFLLRSGFVNWLVLSEPSHGSRDADSGGDSLEHCD